MFNRCRGRTALLLARPRVLARPAVAHDRADLFRAMPGTLVPLRARQFSRFAAALNKIEPGRRPGPDDPVPAGDPATSDRTKDNTRAPRPDTRYESWGSAVSRRLHRPTKDELLKAASGAFERFRIRFKWLLLRQVRPFNMDDMSAFFSWLIVGNVIWIIVGTTTFFSLVIFTANTVFAQETLARMIGNYLTKETGITVVFENAIVPHWNSGVISFRNVFVSRRPGSNTSRVVKGSQATAAAAAAAAASASTEVKEPVAVTDDGNYTQFDLTVDTINVTLSFRRWMNGKGILNDVEVKGIRGLVDRTHVRWLPGVDPRSYKKTHRPGDFEIEHFVLEDALVTILQPNDFRPFQVSIFSCDLPQLRRQWLFYDILGANHISGSYDDSLFTIHPRQRLTNSAAADDESDEAWKKTSRLRVDGVSIDHLNRGIEQGPFSWISSGDVDIVADIMIPSEDVDVKFSQVLQEIVERWERTLQKRQRDDGEENQRGWWTEWRRKRDLDGTAKFPIGGKERYVVFDLRVQLNNARAAVPLLAPELSYVNNALVRPMVAYINKHETYIAVNCRVVKKLSEFDGSWTIFDSGLMEDMSAEVYEAIAANVKDDEERARRMRKVGLWSLQLAFQIVLMSLSSLAI